jgi:dynein heavy chain
VLNFIITFEGLTDQVLSNIVHHEKPELEDERVQMLQSLVRDRSQLLELENRSLDLLHSSSGNILDDEQLITTLDNSKNISSVIKKQVAEAEVTEQRLEQSRKAYLPIAERGALLYFVAEDLASVDITYQFSLHWFIQLFNKCLSTQQGTSKDLQSIRAGGDQERPSSSGKSRIRDAQSFASASASSRHRMEAKYALEKNQDTYHQTIIELVTESFYRVVCYALFARHQLLFSFYLTMRILLHKSEISNDSDQSESSESQFS